MKHFLPLIKSTVKGGLKVALGLIFASAVIGGSVWAYQWRTEVNLAKALKWKEIEAKSLGLKAILHTKFRDGRVQYRLISTTKTKPDVIALSVALLDGDGFTVGSHDVSPNEMIESVGEPGEPMQFDAEGTMDFWLTTEEYRSVKSWELGWKVKR